MLIYKVRFLGTKAHHGIMMDLSLVVDSDFAVVGGDVVETNRWRVILESHFPPPHRGTIMYDGDCEMVAEQLYIDGFLHYFAEGYVIDGNEPETRKCIHSVFNRTVESMYMNILSGLGLNIDGKWEMHSFFKSVDGDKLEELIFRMRKHQFKEEGKPNG